MILNSFAGGATGPDERSRATAEEKAKEGKKNHEHDRVRHGTQKEERKAISYVVSDALSLLLV